jgi:hypothetical protein
MSIQQEELFDGDSRLFRSLLKKSSCYFEYGCGKSTKWVLENTSTHIYSVDTDKFWCHQVLKSTGPELFSRLKVYYVDVGKTGNWGYPISYSERKNFRKYISGLWGINVNADCVLIDGRFRIACFLETVRKAPVGCRIIFDDYRDRPHYHIAEEFLPVREYCGRQALFEVQEGDREKVSESLVQSFQMVMY